MKNLLIYYAYTNSFNYPENSWNNERVAQDMAKYGLIVLGEDIEDPGHADHANACIIINRLKEIKPNILIFGYVTVAQDYSDFKLKASRWNDMGVHGIFMDEAGYDYGKTRAELNERLIYVHSQSSAKLAFLNAWKQKYIMGIENDASYPNSTYNPDLVQSVINEDDWVLLESFPVNTISYNATGQDGVMDKETFDTRVENIMELREQFTFNLACSSMIKTTWEDGQELADFAMTAAMMVCADAFGIAGERYSASGDDNAKAKFWTPISMTFPGNLYEDNCMIDWDVNDTDIAFKHLMWAKLWLDFSDGAKTSGVEEY